MDGSEERKRRPASLAVAIVMGLTAGTSVGADKGNNIVPSNIRLELSRDNVLMAHAILGAARWLRDPKCQALLDEFADSAGQPLRHAFDKEGVAPSEYLGRLSFHKGDPALCSEKWLAYTTRGSHEVFVCPGQLRKVSQENPSYLEAAVIHEALHSLGLGENPPTWQDITDRVLARCRH